MQKVLLDLIWLRMAGGIRRKKNNPSKKRDKRLGPIKVASFHNAALLIPFMFSMTLRER